MIVLWSNVSVKHSRPNIQCENFNELNAKGYKAGEGVFPTASVTRALGVCHRRHLRLLFEIHSKLPTFSTSTSCKEEMTL